MIAAVTADRGYDVTDHEQLMTDLSVYHGRHLDGYRRARKITGRAGEAPTEALRQALLSYRALFFDLLGSPGDGGSRAPVQAPEETADQVPASGRGSRSPRDGTGRPGARKKRDDLPASPAVTDGAAGRTAVAGRRRPAACRRDVPGRRARVMKRKTMR